ncbi:MAG TPA: heme-binding protein [Burkholderiaceae bacterium]|nr:heme-binding protein [Burkholderiaceae bacterium]
MTRPVVVPAALALVAALAASSALAQPRELKAVDRVPTITHDAALAAAQAALADCRKRGASVAVAVVDRAGVPVVVLRDTLAGMHTPDTATRKAWTAVSFRGATTELVGATAPGGPNGGIRHLPNVAMVGGGLMLQSAGSLVGGIGVSGAPSGEMDDQCGKAGIQAIGDALELG